MLAVQNGLNGITLLIQARICKPLAWKSVVPPVSIALISRATIKDCGRRGNDPVLFSDFPLERLPAASASDIAQSGRLNRDITNQGRKMSTRENLTVSLITEFSS